MKNKFLKPLIGAGMVAVTALIMMSSSHREAPMISNDPLADNTDLYAFRSPDNPNTVTIIANFIPFQLPQGGPNYYHFGENIRYEIHIDNNVNTTGDDIVYRFTFTRTNEDPSTFFNIRLGKENLKTTYNLDKITASGTTRIITNGTVPPNNIGERSINSGVGLNAPSYESLMTASIKTASTGEKVFAGPVDDPFFVDLGGIFDLGDAPRQSTGAPRDGVKCKNVSTIALQIPIAMLQKDHHDVSTASNILDGDFVIGVWASASRRSIRTLNGDGTQASSGDWVQISRIGMPLTNEAVIPIGYKDYWNSLTPYQDLSKLGEFGKFFYKPELALYMDDTFFGAAVPAFSPLRIQRNSYTVLGRVGFGNDQNGLYPLKGNPVLNGTALDDNIFGNLLLPAANSPRSVDLWPIFHTGVPNLSPYQLATGKTAGNPLSAGKPFINNFLPNGGDMLRLNMAVPPTPRNSADFSTEGLIAAAVLGLTDARFNTNTSIQNIPNMDGFPNGRRLEDDVTRIELQAVSGAVLAAVGLFYDDYNGTGSPVTAQLGRVLGYTTGVEANDVPLNIVFPYEATPHSGKGDCSGEPALQGRGSQSVNTISAPLSLDLAAPEMYLTASPNPVTSSTTIRYHVAVASQVKISVMDTKGAVIGIIANQKFEPGTYTFTWNATGVAKGGYYISASKSNGAVQTIRVVKQ